MGIYAVTGGSSGIGLQAVRILRESGHEVCNLDIVGGDLSVNLGDASSRACALRELHERYPEGMDGLICNAGVTAGARLTPADVISINFFGAVAMAEGCFDLLARKHGACAITASGALAMYKRYREYDITELLLSSADEPRIRKLIDTFERPLADTQMYIVSKYAIVNWMRRHSAGWSKKGVRLNCVAPGVTATKITDGMPDDAFESVVMSNPMCIYYDQKTMMPPADVASVLVYAVSDTASGVTGQLLFADGGTADILKTESFL